LSSDDYGSTADKYHFAVRHLPRSQRDTSRAHSIWRTRSGSSEVQVLRQRQHPTPVRDGRGRNNHEHGRRVRGGSGCGWRVRFTGSRG
jgi:hypothetical protein